MTREAVTQPKFWSANGEELVIERILYLLEESPKKYSRYMKYVELGCGHPTYHNNTYYYYLLGYKGIAIEANRDLIADIKRTRPADIVYHNAVTDIDAQKTTLCDSAIIDTWLGEDYDNRAKVRREEVTTITMQTIIKQHPEFSAVDFFDVDIDTGEEHAMAGCDFTTFTPTVILIENLVREIDQTERFCKYLDPFYHYIGNVGGNGIYLRHEWFYPYFVEEHNKRVVR